MFLLSFLLDMAPHQFVGHDRPKLEGRRVGAKVSHHGRRLLRVQLDCMNLEACIHQALHVASGARAENHSIGIGLALVLAEVLSEVRRFLAGVDDMAFSGPEIGPLARADDDVVAVVEVHGHVDVRGEVGDRAMNRNEAAFNRRHTKMGCELLVLLALVPEDRLDVRVRSPSRDFSTIAR